jgi:succinoglycan biosynthesis transport protein ExoP
MAAPQPFVSVSRRPPDVEDYIDILRRHRSWVIGPTFAGLVISVVVAFFLPDVFVCSAAMQIRPGAVSNDLMPSAMSGKMAQRLQELSLEILARDNLITLIQNPKLNLYPKERQRYSVEDVAEDTFRKHVHIVQYETANGAAGSQAFHISFEYPDRYVARLLVVELISEFTNKNLVFQQNTSNITSTFFDDLVKTAKDKMEQKQVDLANFTSENQGRLPENFSGNMVEVTTRQQTITNLNQRVSDERQRQSILESELSNNKNLQSQAEQNMNTVINTPNQQVKNQNLINLESDINKKQQECVALERRYQPEYPDVQSCHDQVKALQDKKEEIANADPTPVQSGGGSKTVVNNAVAQQLNQLRAEENSIRSKITASVMQQTSLEKQLAAQSKDLQDAQAKINASPQVIQKYNQLSNDLKMAQDDYKELSTKKGTAGTQKEMEDHRAGETLEILEQPITPEKAASPVRPAIVGIGTIIGLIVGVALAGGKEVKNTSLKNLKDVRAYTNLPVLSSIPLLENALLVRRKRRLSWLAWSSALIVGTILMSGAMYYHYVIAGQAS